jgi:deoxycytidine triphosphate deaminase
MYLSSRDIKWAIDCGKLIVDPRPEALEPPRGYDETSIDLHLGPLKLAKVWNLETLRHLDTSRGANLSEFGPEVHLGAFDWETFSIDHLKGVPEGETDEKGKNRLVYRRADAIIVRQLGFVLWPTREEIGTPTVDLANDKPQRHPELICFVDGKSTKARTGLIVHLTAPTIHAGWSGHVILEISNLGPFTFVLKEGDALAQLTVATISSAPDLGLKTSKSKTHGQKDPSGSPRPARQPSRKKRST